MKTHKKPSRTRHKLRVLLFWLNIMALFLTAWTINCEPRAHVTPPYSQTDISALLEARYLTASDYQTLYRQTGLSHTAVEKLLAQNRQEEILKAQEYYFREIHVSCEPNTIVSREERITDKEGRPVIDVEKGDILITFCSHTFGWRNGHAALVIDPENRLTLEAQVLGEPSRILSLDRWERYPSYAVLRLTEADRETRSGIADYARKHLVDIPYHLTAGLPLFTEQVKNVDGTMSPSGTQCAHLVWYAYSMFGYDLDSDGGFIVTPEDLFRCGRLEIVQSYGM